MSRFLQHSELLADILQKKPSNGGHASIVPPKLLETIASSAHDQFGRLLNNMFNATDDLFYDLSSRATSNSEANLYFEAMREIRVQKKGLTHRSLRSLTEGFVLMLEGAVLNQNSTNDDREALEFGDLSLVQSDDLEVDLAYTNMISSAKSLHLRELYDLSARLDHLLLHVRVEDDNNPLHPGYVCQCFLESCSDSLNIDIKMRLIFYKQFEKHVLKQLGHLYAEANQLLRDAGILPRVPRNMNQRTQDNGAHDVGVADSNKTSMGSAAVNPQSLGSKTALPPGAKAYILSPTGQANPVHFQMTQVELQSILANVRQLNQPADADAILLSSPINYTLYTTNPGPLMPASDLVNYLNQSQINAAHQSLADAGPRNIIGSIVNKALKERSSNTPQALDQHNEDIINLVALFFDQVIAEKNLSSVIQSAICRLQIPILKVALHDSSFFNDQNHPVRSFVNVVTDIGIGFDENKPLTKDPLYQKIVAVTDYINEHYDNDINIFIEQKHELEAAITKERRKADIVEKRTRQSEQGKVQLQQAKSQAQDAIYKKIKDISLPTEVSRFLSSSWLQVLMIVHLRNGTESTEWIAMEQVVTDLIWICKPHEDRRSQLRRQRLFPALLDLVEDALATAIDNVDTRRNLVNQLEKTIVNIIEDQIDEVSFEALQPEQKEELGRGEKDQKPWDEMTAVEKQQMRYDELSKHFFDAAKNLREGTWLDLTDSKSHKKTRCKLAAIVDHDNYIFVNRMGFKACTKTRKELAYDMQFHRASIVDNTPLFDRMMEKVVTDLAKSETA